MFTHKKTKKTFWNSAEIFLITLSYPLVSWKSLKSPLSNDVIIFSINASWIWSYFFLIQAFLLIKSWSRLDSPLSRCFLQKSKQKPGGGCVIIFWTISENSEQFWKLRKYNGVLKFLLLSLFFWHFNSPRPTSCQKGCDSQALIKT